jgi:uncharacterized membrane protein
MDELEFAVTLAAAIGAGLIGGVFFAFSSFIMAALARIPAPQGIAAMQAINVTVLNPAFLAIFVGTGAIGVVSAALTVTELGEAASLLRIAGALLYVVGCLVVTGVGNVPRNNALDRLAPESPESEAVWRNLRPRMDDLEQRPHGCLHPLRRRLHRCACHRLIERVPG